MPKIGGSSSPWTSRKKDRRLPLTVSRKEAYEWLRPTDDRQSVNLATTLFVVILVAVTYVLMRF